MFPSSYICLAVSVPASQPNFGELPPVEETESSSKCPGFVGKTTLLSVRQGKKRYVYIWTCVSVSLDWWDSLTYICSAVAGMAIYLIGRSRVPHAQHLVAGPVNLRKSKSDTVFESRPKTSLTLHSTIYSFYHTQKLFPINLEHSLSERISSKLGN